MTAIAMVVAALVGSLTPQLAPPSQGGIDKVIHFGAYGALGIVFCMAIPGRWRYALAGIAVCALSSGIELLQEMVPERNGSWEDMAANVVGCALGLAALKLFATARKSSF